MKKWILLLAFLVGCASTEKQPEKPVEEKPPVVVKPEPMPEVPSKPVETKPEIPAIDSTWSLQYNGEFKDLKRDYVILSLWKYNPKELPKHSKYIAYFSMHYERWRPDASEFKKSWLCGELDDWPGEEVVCKNHVDDVLPIMYKRIDLAKEKGYIGIDPDNLDQLPRKEGVYYWKKLAAYARSKGLLIDQKNAGSWNDDLDPDFYQVEQCVQYSECDRYTGRGRAVFDIEYSSKNKKKVPGVWLIQKDMEDMDEWESLP